MGKVFLLVFGCWLSTTIGLIIYACLTTNHEIFKLTANMNNNKKNTKNNLVEEGGLLKTPSPSNNASLPSPSPPQSAELAEYETDKNELAINEDEGDNISVDESQDKSTSKVATTTITTTAAAAPSSVRNGKRKKKEEVAVSCVGCPTQNFGGVKKVKKTPLKF